MRVGLRADAVLEALAGTQLACEVINLRVRWAWLAPVNRPSSLGGAGIDAAHIVEGLKV